MKRKDYWSILGLRKGASEKEVRSAYKRLAKKYHPDVNAGDKEAEEKFKEISEAYAVLSDPKKRRQWEQGEVDFESFFRQGGAGRQTGFEGAFGFGAGVQEILEELFGSGGMRGGFRGARGSAGGFPTQGADLQYETTVGFEQAVSGTILRLPLARTAACPECGGAGCGRCGGSGHVRSNETLNVKIPAGVDDGAKVRVAGKGEAGARGGPPGDLYVLLRVAPHPYFRREGRDILLDLPLTVGEAALGTRVDVPTIGGRVTLTVPPGSSSGRKLRLRSRGVPGRGGKAGDQIVVIQIVTPESLDDESRNLIRSFEERNRLTPRAKLGW